ncbi:PD-(D/E)XK nuclease family transposase [Paenibacillus ehimensis]|uniref:PD-(D/E)XK nuclease family transposase n=1 Tax=Paenibacillus ehimensis TaxID=79264 RepID=A0ABT8VC95_9BACL|nr:PD-(D/E)XK nuclease family transposase [Paenibacillus ehimensis]MDO3678611.1 PD-(D/E)XK nuclease family transposase [Paenibacillus ehimensis]
MDTPGLKKAMTTLEFLSQNKEARALYEMRKKALLDEQSALDYAEGRRKT